MFLRGRSPHPERVGRPFRSLAFHRPHPSPAPVRCQPMNEPVWSFDDEELVRGLRAGDEKAFVILVDRHNQSLLRIARSFVTNAAVAEEVVQDTWMAVVRGISRFEGRCSL